MSWVTDGLLATIAMKQYELASRPDPVYRGGSLTYDPLVDAQIAGLEGHVEELVDELRASREAAEERDRRTAEVPYWGPTVSVAELGIPDLATAAAPIDETALRALVHPLNVVVSGGTDDFAWAVAETVREVLGTTLHGIRLEAGGKGSGQAGNLPVLVAGLNEADVLLVGGLEQASETTLRMLRGIAVDASITVTIGKGGSARDMSLSLKPLVVVLHAPAGRIPRLLAGGFGAWIGGPLDTKACPFCAETIKSAAIVCRYCGRDLPTGPSEESGSEPETPAASVVHPPAIDPEAQRAVLSELVAKLRLRGLDAIGLGDEAGLLGALRTLLAAADEAFSRGRLADGAGLLDDVEKQGIAGRSAALTVRWAELVDRAAGLATGEILPTFDPEQWRGRDEGP